MCELRTIVDSATTRDGATFRLGQTVYTEFGRDIETSPDTHVIYEETFQVDGETVVHRVLYRKDGNCGFGLNCLYSSRDARVADQVAYLEKMKRKIDQEIAFLKGGGDPESAVFLNHFAL